MIGHKIFIQWIILYLFLATPGSQVVLCWGDEDHFALETLSTEADHHHTNGVYEKKTVTFTYHHPDCDADTCFDLPLSLTLHPEPIAFSALSHSHFKTALTKIWVNPAFIDRISNSRPIHRRLTGDLRDFADPLKPLLTLRSVCLLI